MRNGVMWTYPLAESASTKLVIAYFFESSSVRPDFVYPKPNLMQKVLGRVPALERSGLSLQAVEQTHGAHHGW